MRKITKETRPRFNWKEWSESHPLKVIGAAVVAAISCTSAVWYEDLKLTTEHCANQFQKTQNELDDFKTRFSSIVPHIGDTSIWDLSAMVITPAQAKTLSPAYIYYADIHCLLKVPESSSWSFVRTTESDLWQMLYPNTMDPNSTKPSDNTIARLEMGKTLNILLWKCPGSFKINTIDVETPTLCIFPYVSIEEFTDQDVLEKLDTTRKNLLSILDQLKEEAKTSSVGYNQVIEFFRQWSKQHGARLDLPTINPNISSELDA
jgi:hypothetical protein